MSPRYSPLRAYFPSVQLFHGQCGVIYQQSEVHELHHSLHEVIDAFRLLSNSFWRPYETSPTWPVKLDEDYMARVNFGQQLMLVAI